MGDRSSFECVGGDCWETPAALFRQLDDEFLFTLDPCCLPATAKCPRYYTPSDDGLSKSWRGERVFMNPPYSMCDRWVEKAWFESKGVDGATVVCLLPARVDSEWWSVFVIGGVTGHHASEVRYIRGRVRFNLAGSPMGSPRQPSVIVVFRPYCGTGVVSSCLGSGKPRRGGAPLLRGMA